MSATIQWIDIVFEEVYPLLSNNQYIPCYYDLCCKTTEEVNYSLRCFEELKEGIPVDRREFVPFEIVAEQIDEIVISYVYVLDGGVVSAPSKRVW
jgi:hypothetical protein